MASALATATSASALATATSASVSVTVPRKPCFSASTHRHRHFSLISNCLRPNYLLMLRFFPMGLHSSRRRSTATILRANLNVVPGDETIDDSAYSGELPSLESRDDFFLNGQSEASEQSLSEEFITHVLSLVKLVDSRNIAELQLKYPDCELLIRKNEAQPFPPPTTIAYSLESPVAPQISSPTAPVLPSTTAPKSQESSSTFFKSPMAGTFYRNPGPGKPPYVEVGDKVQKGQVVCIIEAMKLMNEIEVGQSGTILEFLAVDGKPVGLDAHLFSIKP